MSDPAPSDFVALVREQTGVGSAEYEIDGTAYWTDEQLAALHTAGLSIDAACARVLDSWAAVLSSAYDITVDGQSLKRSQLAQAKRLLADEHRARAAGVTSIPVAGFGGELPE